LRVAIDQGVEFPLHLLLRAAGQLLHARPVDSAGVVKRNRERLGRRLDVLCGFAALQRAPLEDRGFLRALRFGVVVFKGEEQGLIGISGERAEIHAAGEGPYLETNES
jgi:hypothetical protein